MLSGGFTAYVDKSPPLAMAVGCSVLQTRFCDGYGTLTDTVAERSEAGLAGQGGCAMTTFLRGSELKVRSAESLLVEESSMQPGNDDLREL